MSGIPPDVPALRVNRFAAAWRKLGIGSLALSLALHLLVFFIAGILVFTSTREEKPADFVPGGGTVQGGQAAAELEHRVQQKRRNALVRGLPVRRMVSLSDASIILPESPPDLDDLPAFTPAVGGGGRLSGGFGNGGSGGGFGNGTGTGSRSSVAFMPVMMFGMELKSTRKVAVVMDVSPSMAPYLPAVVAEIDKLASQSALVLYSGCGLTAPLRPPNSDVHPATGGKFADFCGKLKGVPSPKILSKLSSKQKAKLLFAPAVVRPLDLMYKCLSDRPGTFFAEHSGMSHAQVALLSEELAAADTIYWFADFQDNVDDFALEYLRGELMRRHQKLFIHAASRGRSFEKVRDRLVTPLGGSVIEVAVERTDAKR